MAKSTPVTQDQAKRLATEGIPISPEEQELMEFLGLTGREGKELIKSDDIVIPRISIVQALSPQVKERTANPGDIFNVVTNVNYTQGSKPGETILKFIPLMFFGTRIMWEGDLGTPIECIARDGENGSKYGNCNSCNFKDFTINEQNGRSDQPKCTEFKNIMLIPLPDGVSPRDQAPAAFSGKRGSLNAMKQFVTQMMALRYNGREVPMYSHTWGLRVVEAKGDKGEYYVPKFEDLGMITDMSTLKYMRSVYQQLESARGKFSIPQENEVAPGTTTYEPSSFDPKPETQVDY